MQKIEMFKSMYDDRLFTSKVACGEHELETVLPTEIGKLASEWAKGAWNSGVLPDEVMQAIINFVTDRRDEMTMLLTNIQRGQDDAYDR